jgi:hypothetical protein
MSDAPEAAWSNATWDGSRRAQLRIALAMTVRERLLAMEALGELSDQLAAMPRINGPDAGPSKPIRK